MRILIAEDSQTQAVELRHKDWRPWGTRYRHRRWSASMEQAPGKARAAGDPGLDDAGMNGLDLCRKIRAEIKSTVHLRHFVTAKTHRHERLQA